MNNLMDTYLSFTEKKIKKYMKSILNQYYDEQIINEYLRTYINARYYNIQNSEKPARAFYLRILDELEYKEDILMKKCEEEVQTLDEKQKRFNLIDTTKEVFACILFFDNVRNVENFKTIDSIREIIEKAIKIVNSEFGVKFSDVAKENLYKEIKNDMLEKDIFLDKFDTDEFVLNFESSELADNIFFVKLQHDIKMPMQYSEDAIEKVFSEGIIAEDKLQIEYLLLSVVSIRDIVNGNFKDTYIAEFTNTLFKKKQKLEGILAIIENQALQDKINLNIDYLDYIQNQKKILEYTKRGFNFAITLDSSIKSVEDVEKLKMFKLIIVPKNLELYKEIKSKASTLNNVVFK